jgi:hypothetical protein
MSLEVRLTQELCRQTERWKTGQGSGRRGKLPRVLFRAVSLTWMSASLRVTGGPGGTAPVRNQKERDSRNAVTAFSTNAIHSLFALLPGESSTISVIPRDPLSRPSDPDGDSRRRFPKDRSKHADVDSPGWNDGAVTGGAGSFSCVRRGTDFLSTTGQSRAPGSLRNSRSGRNGTRPKWG